MIHKLFVIKGIGRPAESLHRGAPPLVRGVRTLVRPSGAMVALAESRHLVYIMGRYLSQAKAKLAIRDWRPGHIMAMNMFAGTYPRTRHAAHLGSQPVH